MTSLITVISGESIAIFLGVDRILDMCRTVLDVTGDVTRAAYIAQWKVTH